MGELEERRGRRVVKLSSPDRVLFPEDRVTKGELFEYYRDVASVLVPHLRDRPFTMKRFREGITAPGFFQKDAPKGMPDWIPTKKFRTYPREGGSRLVDSALVNDEPALLWASLDVRGHAVVRRHARRATRTTSSERSHHRLEERKTTWSLP